MKYIATFYSHFGAVRFGKNCKANGWDYKLKPVPRDLSSSCGTCVFFEMNENFETAKHNILTDKDEIEQVVSQTGDGYIVKYKAENS